MAIRLAAAIGVNQNANPNYVSKENNMTILKLSSRGGVISAICLQAVTLVLVTVILLAGCTGSKSSNAVVSQGSANATLVQPSNAKDAKLADLHGTVEVKTGDSQWTLAKSGQTLKSGQYIRTGALSNVTLAYYDGSYTYLGAEAEIALDARTSGARLVQLTQVSGESQHEVAKSDDPGSHYDVNTPAGNGSTNNATFTAMVFPDQLSQFWVEAGDVSVINENVTVVVAAGQTTSVLVGQPPIEPEYRVTGEGQVMQISTIDGSSSAILPTSAPNAQENQNGKITLCHATGSATNPYVEITVSVAGATHGHAKHPGDIIPAPADGCPISPITSSTSTSWNIAGQTFRTGASIVIFGNPQPGDWVSFEGRQLADGTRFADRVVLLDHSSEDQFIFIGKVESIGDTAWTISSRVVQINEFTTIDAGLKLGDNVQVLGGIAEDGTFLATSLSRTDGVGSNFRFSGVLTNINNNVWIISGIKVTVDGNTTLYGDFVLGNPLEVEGVIKEDGTWLATTINLVTPGGYHFEYTGVVQSLSPWIVSGVSFDTADWTEIDAGIKVGDKVRVAGVENADGIWVAETIELLDTTHPTSFAFFGPVLSINPWNVRGVSLTVDGNTIIKSDITVGEMVKVTGWILDDGTWLATEIKHTGLHLGQGCFLVTSVVQSISGDQILLADGQTLVRTGDLVVTGDLKDGSMVRYQFCVDEQGQSKIGSVTVVYQMEELPQAKAVICHYPPGNPGNRHTIEVGQPAVPAHLAHGDTLGPCPSEKLDKQPKKDK
jgi:LysM repeat protein